MQEMIQSMRRRTVSPGLARFAWFLIGYTMLVILWGAYVRATGSGAGCGSHWPTCNGAFVPRPERIETQIEFTHRLSSGIMGPLGIGLIYWAWKVYGWDHRVTKGAIWTFGLILVEGALGAGLVLFELVADNASSARALAMAIHLINTLLLLTAATLTAWWASGGRPLALKEQPGPARAIAIGLIGLMIVGGFGAITALGDTLFPAASFIEGAAAKFDASAHFSVKARLWHPLIAVGLSIYLLVILWTTPLFRETAVRRFFVRLNSGLIVVQLLGGLVNVLLAAPIFMQMIHLLLADMAWISLVLLAGAALEQKEGVDLPPPAAQTDFPSNGRTSIEEPARSSKI